MGCSLAVLVGPRGSLLFLTHVEARIRSRSFIVDATQRRPRRRPPDRRAPGRAFGGVHPVRIGAPRSEVRRPFRTCIRNRVAFCISVLIQWVVPPVPGYEDRRARNFDIVYSVMHTNFPERPVRGL